MDYYKELGLQKNASKSEIKAAYRKMAQKYHPDKNPDDPAAEEKFKQCSEAYSVLGDPQKKKEYDQFGTTGRPQHSHPGQGFGGFGDIFGDIFGRKSKSQRGTDLLGSLHLSFEEAVFGCTRPVTFDRSGQCLECAGTGAAGGTKHATCTTCSGSGSIRHRQGAFIVQATCPSCKGRGRIIEVECTNCNGSGVSIEECSIDISIPPGTQHGSKIRIQGAGESGPSGHRGDVYVEISVADHPYFKRDGSSIYSRIDIKFSEAVLGAEVEVPTVHGGEKILIPPGIQAGTTLRLKGKGAPVLRSPSCGDHFVSVNISVPTDLNEEQKEALRAVTHLGF